MVRNISVTFDTKWKHNTTHTAIVSWPPLRSARRRYILSKRSINRYPFTRLSYNLVEDGAHRRNYDSAHHRGADRAGGQPQHHHAPVGLFPPRQILRDQKQCWFMLFLCVAAFFRFCSFTVELETVA